MYTTVVIEINKLAGKAVNISIKARYIHIALDAIKELEEVYKDVPFTIQIQTNHEE